MKKVTFSKEETRNLINMLLSEDADNHIIAFEALKNVDFKKYIGELLVMYKFSKHSLQGWRDNCEEVYDKLFDIVLDSPMTSGKVLGLMINHNSSKDSIELFLEYFVRDMTKILGEIGYPIDKFEIDIKLKDE
jgi:hypothetical protein